MNKNEAPQEAEAGPGQDLGEEQGASAGEGPLQDEAAQGETAQDVERLQQELKQAEARLREVSKAFREQQEGMQAFRERAQNQATFKADRRSYEAVQAFLEPVQNLGRSIETPGEDMEGLIEGLKLVHRQFRDGLDSLGLEPVPGKGALFDPNMHEAIAVMPVTDPLLDNRVIEVVKPGFMVNGKVLHAGQVVIGQHNEDDVES